MAVKRSDINKFLEFSGQYPVLDVRSPGEYHEGHLPGALSFPLFTNDERAEVGTLYKTIGKYGAIKKGLELVGPKMVSFLEKAEALESKKMALYCWRGGMRSESMAWLLDRCGYEVWVLEKGYKSYRSKVLRFFEQKLPLKVITGYTGSKKTYLLGLLKEMGEQVIDLEALASHQGSSFGNQKSSGQPTTEQFQNHLFGAFQKMDLDRTIWIEDENMKIGQVFLPEALYLQKNCSPHIFIEVPRPQRARFLVGDYGDLSSDQLVAATQSISRKLGKENSQEATECIEKGDLEKAALIVLTYYDKRYHKSIQAKNQYVTEHIKTDISNIEKVAEELVKRSKNGL